MTPRTPRLARACLVVLPALVLFALALSVAPGGAARGGPAAAEPSVLVAEAAAAFAAALAPDVKLPEDARCDIVVIVPAPPQAALVLLIDLARGRKLWARVPAPLLGRILARMGAPA